MTEPAEPDRIDVVGATPTGTNQFHADGTRYDSRCRCAEICMKNLELADETPKKAYRQPEDHGHWADELTFVFTPPIEVNGRTIESLDLSHMPFVEGGPTKEDIVHAMLNPIDEPQEEQR